MLHDDDDGKTHPAVGFNPTAELLAAHFREALPELIPGLAARLITTAVGVSETPKTWAWAR